MVNKNSDKVKRFLDNTEIWGVLDDKLSTRIQFNNQDEVYDFLETTIDVLKGRKFSTELSVTESNLLIDLEINEAALDAGKEIEKKLGKM